ncbi:CPCC family cysteine-rich protein [Sphingomonas sp. NPDC092331]|jgi:Cysteine-rich CPCC|uniref:CPCC family cysteine-rich protein n=1 Tax=unclassified Sphingomonas TaxID=196159 RepID=UPI0029F0B605|nr:hypothetical protein [Pseudomonadota bacterium]
MTLAPCPCCRSPALTDPGGFEICQICGWEDDGQGDADADVMRGGPNGNLSLAEARRRFAKHAALEAQLRASPRWTREGNK